MHLVSVSRGVTRLSASCFVLWRAERAATRCEGEKNRACGLTSALALPRKSIFCSTMRSPTCVRRGEIWRAREGALVSEGVSLSQRLDSLRGYTRAHLFSVHTLQLSSRVASLSRSRIVSSLQQPGQPSRDAHDPPLPFLHFNRARTATRSITLLSYSYQGHVQLDYSATLALFSGSNSGSPPARATW